MSKSSRRRLRKSKQNVNSNKTQSELYIDKISTFTLEYVKKLVLSAYIKDISKDIDGVIPDEIGLVCSNFYGKIKPNKLDGAIPKIMKIVMERDSTKQKLWCHCCSPLRYPGIADMETFKTRRFTFNTHFSQFPEYMKKLFCKRIIIDKKYAIHSIALNPDDNIILKQHFEYFKYILLKRFKTVHKINLCKINLTDTDIVYLCNMIEDIIKYQTQRAQKQIQRIERNKNINIKMNLHEINLSLNPNITDKNIPLLLRTIKKYLPKMKDLYLSSTSATNKSISTIMKYNIDGMKVHLTDCNKVTLKALNKHIRGDYEDDIVDKYVYCKKLIYFANINENESRQSNHGQRRIRKNKAKKWKR